jgi:hypothetical protein
LSTLRKAAASNKAIMMPAICDRSGIYASNSQYEQLNDAQGNHQHRESYGIVIEPMPHDVLRIESTLEAGRAKTKSDLVVMPSAGRIFAFFCSPHDHGAQNSGCDYTA